MDHDGPQPLYPDGGSRPYRVPERRADRGPADDLMPVDVQIEMLMDQHRSAPKGEGDLARTARRYALLSLVLGPLVAMQAIKVGVQGFVKNDSDNYRWYGLAIAAAVVGSIITLVVVVKVMGGITTDTPQQLQDDLGRVGS